MKRRKKRKPLKLVTVPSARTDEDFAQSAAMRSEKADQSRAMIASAIEDCGPRATAYARWEIMDRYDPPGSPPCRVIYCCRRPEHTGWKPGPEFEGDDERMGPPLQGFCREAERFKDEPYQFGFRYMVRFHYLEEYEPRSAEELKAAAEKRRTKAIAENEKRIAAERELEKKNVTPSLFEGLE